MAFGWRPARTADPRHRLRLSRHHPSLERRPAAELAEKAQSNFTDPESSLMKTSGEGFQQCYNAQAVQRAGAAVEVDEGDVVGRRLPASIPDTTLIAPASSVNAIVDCSIILSSVRTVIDIKSST